MVGLKCKNNIAGRTKLFYMLKYFRRGGVRWNKTGGGKSNLTRQGQLSLETKIGKITAMLSINNVYVTYFGKARAI